VRQTRTAIALTSDSGLRACSPVTPSLFMAATSESRPQSGPGIAIACLQAAHTPTAAKRNRSPISRAFVALRTLRSAASVAASTGGTAQSSNARPSSMCTSSHRSRTPSAVGGVTVTAYLHFVRNLAFLLPQPLLSATCVHPAPKQTAARFCDVRIWLIMLDLPVAPWDASGSLRQAGWRYEGAPRSTRPLRETRQRQFSVLQGDQQRGRMSPRHSGILRNTMSRSSPVVPQPAR
jgi:hypothetical protein